MPDWMTPAEAADFLRRSERTVRRWAEEKRIQKHRVGGPGSRPLYKTSELEDLIVADSVDMPTSG